MRDNRKKKTVFVFVGLVTDDEGKILLINRKEKELPEADNRWELPGGKLEFGETIGQAVEREILEETGYRVKALSLIPKPYYSLWHYPDFDQHTVIFCLRCKLAEGKAVAKQDHHVNRLGWFSLDELDSLLLLPGVRFFIGQA